MIDANEEKIIIEAIDLSAKGLGGVRTIPLIDGALLTNYVPLRRWFREHPWTTEHSEYVKSLYKEATQ